MSKITSHAGPVWTFTTTFEYIEYHGKLNIEELENTKIRNFLDAVPGDLAKAVSRARVQKVGGNVMMSLDIEYIQSSIDVLMTAPGYDSDRPMLLARIAELEQKLEELDTGRPVNLSLEQVCTFIRNYMPDIGRNYTSSELAGIESEKRNIIYNIRMNLRVRKCTAE